MKIWGMEEDGKCECGEERDADHLFTWSLLPAKRRKEEFIMINDITDKIIRITVYWEGKGI